MSAEQNADLASRWLKVFNDRDLEGLLALYADDCEHSSPKIRVVHPETGGRLLGKAALRAWWEDAFRRLPRLHYALTAVTADAERAVLEYVRNVPGEPPLHVAEAFDVANGRIVRSRVYHG